MSLVEKEVQSLINTLGFLDKGVYYLEPDCFQNVRDLIRHLHRDDRLFTVRRLCMNHNIVKNDLIPILKTNEILDELFDAALRLCVNLCQPTLMVFGGKLPEDTEEWQIFYELESSLVRSLTSFVDSAIFTIFCKHINEYFDMDWEDRTEKQRLLVERIFVLIRYTFAIGVEGAKYLSVDTLVRERVIVNLFSSGIDAIFLKLASNSMEREFCCYIVAILALIFKTMDPQAIAKEGNEHCKEGQAKFEKEGLFKIEAAKNEEANRRKTSRRAFLAGTYVVKGVKALNTDNDFVLRGAMNNTTENGTIPAVSAPLEVLSKRKRPRKLPKNRRVNDLEVQPTEEYTSALQQLNPEAMLSIKDFCWRLLAEGRYNKLMRITKELAFVSSNRQQMQQKLNELHYFTLCTFMMAFARHSHTSCQNVSATFSVEFFHQITAYLTNCFDLMKTDRGGLRKYALSAQHAISAFKEMMIMLNSISSLNFPADKEYFVQFCTQIFQLEEYRELAAGILSHLSPAGTTHKMLQELIVANHYFHHLMEKNVKRGELIKIRKKKRQKRQKKVQERKHREQEKLVSNTMKLGKLNELWNEIKEELSNTLVGELPSNKDASPINNLLSDLDDEQQQAFALFQVQIALRTQRLPDAVGMYRNARVLWPETGNFGDDQMKPEEECLAMQEIFETDMKTIGEKYKEAIRDAYGHPMEEEMTEENEHMEDEENEPEQDDDELKEEEAAPNDVVETDFDFNGFISSSATPAIINWYIFCLKRHRTNPQEVNLAILKFFHRIAFDLKSPARLYLATLFKILREIGQEIHEACPNKENRNYHPNFKLFEFGYHLLRKFFSHYKERGGGIIACELLFSKTPREAYEIEYGYGSL